MPPVLPKFVPAIVKSLFIAIPQSYDIACNMTKCVTSAAATRNCFSPCVLAND